MKPSELNDDNNLVGATYHGHAIPIYDDGYGKLFIHRDSRGISGIVRARTLEDAYGICEDEFFPEAGETVDELRKEYGFRRETVKIIYPRPGYAETRPATPEDHPLKEGQFVCWETTAISDPEAWMENELFREAYGFRPNGPNEKDTLKHGIYSRDLNGDFLDRLTDGLAAELGIELTIEVPA